MAFVLDDLAIAALIASLGGTALQYKANQDAAARADEETRKALARQDALQREAEQKALGQAQQFNTPDRQVAQQQIEQQLTQEFTQPAESAQNIHAQQATTQGNVSDDYTAAKAASDLNTLKNARALAGLFAKTTAASRLRGNEAIQVADTAAGIDRLGNFSRGQAGADQLAIENAARPDAGTQLVGGLLQAAGTAALAGGAGKAAGAAGGSGITGGGGLGFQATGSTGLKVPKLLQYVY